MQRKDVKQNIKLGAFVVGGILLFLISLFYLGQENNMFSRTSTISAIFKNVDGLKEGDNVRLSGVKIGTVKRIQIVSEGEVFVDLSLNDKQIEFIRRDATASVGSDGFVGSKIVVIKPGINKETIHDNDTINALSLSDSQELLSLARDVGANTRSITDNLKLVAERLNRGEGVFGELLKDGPLAMDLRSSIQTLKETSKNANHATADIQKILAEVKNGDGLITKLINDTVYANKFESALSNIAIVGENSKNMSMDLQAIISKMKSGDNAINVLLADTAFANKLKGTLDNARSASIKLNENMDALQHNFLFRGYFKKKRRADEKGN